jgi:hypothetical protein
LGFIFGLGGEHADKEKGQNNYIDYYGFPQANQTQPVHDNTSFFTYSQELLSDNHDFLPYARKYHLHCRIYCFPFVWGNLPTKISRFGNLAIMAPKEL